MAIGCQFICAANADDSCPNNCDFHGAEMCQVASLICIGLRKVESWLGMLYSTGFARGTLRAFSIQSQISLVKVLRAQEILAFLSANKRTEFKT
jgi:hypothetical protein